jgi:hypothetical protein
MYILQPKLCVCDEFLLSVLFKYSKFVNYSLNQQPSAGQGERERIKKFICKPVYFIEKYSGPQSS